MVPDKKTMADWRRLARLSQRPFEMAMMDCIDELEAQLPEGMKNCTIQFKECPKGHGRLTAANWIDHGCEKCKRDELKAQRDELLAACKDLLPWAETWCRELDSKSVGNLYPGIRASTLNRARAAIAKAAPLESNRPQS